MDIVYTTHMALGSDDCPWGYYKSEDAAIRAIMIISHQSRENVIRMLDDGIWTIRSHYLED